VSEHFRKVLDEIVTAVAENNEVVFTRYMGSAKKRLVSGEEQPS